jgi:hypothetical protein
MAGDGGNSHASDDTSPPRAPTHPTIHVGSPVERNALIAATVDAQGNYHVGQCQDSFLGRGRGAVLQLSAGSLKIRLKIRYKPFEAISIDSDTVFMIGYTF